MAVGVDAVYEYYDMLAMHRDSELWEELGKILGRSWGEELSGA